MPAEPRPSDVVTPETLLIGMPFVEFAPLSGGVFGPYVNLGIIDSAALAKEIELIALESSHSGTRKLVRELVSRLKPTLNIGSFQFSPEVLQFVLASATKTPISANPTQAVTDERVSATQDTLDFLDLKNGAINAGSVVVTPATIEDELIGTGDGTKGAVAGDYALKYKVKAHTDIAGTIDVTNAGVVTSYTPVAVGGSGVGLKVEVATGNSADSGNLQFFNGAAPVNLTGTIVATYTPTWTLTEGLPGGSLDAVANAQSDDGGVFTNETTDANSAGAADVTLTPAVPAVNDAFYIGMQTPFDRVRVVIATPGTNYTVVWEYHDGSAWVALSNVFDKTNAFKAAAGTYDVTFDVPAGWKQIAVNALGPFFFVRARVATIAAPTGATGTQIWTSFSNDYLVDRKRGKLQLHTDLLKTTTAGYRAILAGQPVFVDYTYNRAAYTELRPFSQGGLTFAGKARIRHLPDVGINLVWEIPSAQIQLSGDELAFSDEDFTVGTAVIGLLEDPVEGYGTLKHYDETQAGN